MSVLVNDTKSASSEHVPVGGNHQCRLSKDIAEWRFRDALRVAVEGSLSLPPSMLPLTDVKSRPPPKSQSSGKQRLKKSEISSKSSKSRSKKIVMDSNEVLSLLRDPNLQPPSMPPIDLSLSFDPVTSIPGVLVDDFLTTLEMGNESFDTVSHIYVRASYRALRIVHYLASLLTLDRF